MNPLRAILIPAGICVSAGALAQLPKSQQGFDAYSMIRSRNIFDSERTPALPGAQPTPAVTAPPPKPSDFVALTGVMFDGGRGLAFFSGSRPDYDKVLPLNSDIAGARLTKITPLGIEVESAGKSVAVGIGQTVPLDNSTAPGVPPAGFGQEAAAATPSSSSDGDDSSSPDSTPLPANLDSIMRRMMERRQQELR